MFFRDFAHHINQEVFIYARTNQSKMDLKQNTNCFYQGRGIGIAILDTGVSPVDDFLIPENRIVAFRDFVNGKDSPYDDNGHGTHVWYQFLLFKTLGTLFPNPSRLSKVYFLNH